MATAAALGLTANQFANLLGIVRAVKARGWPVKAAYIAVEAALDESGMRILASANVPASRHYPHDLVTWEPDGLGHDHASMGMFQQQTGTAWTPAGYGRAMNQTTMSSPNGWGAPAELMNAQLSTAKFLNALARHPWQQMTNWAAAQAVQGSAYPDGSNYRSQDARARRYVDAVWATPTPPAPSKENEMTMIYRVPDIPGAGGNVFTRDAGLVDPVFGTGNAFSVATAIGHPIATLAALPPITNAQHAYWAAHQPARG